MAERYDPETYWERTLTESFTLQGIAFPTFPESLNRAIYASMIDTVDRILRAEKIDVRKRSVLDVGCAIGIWIDFWRRRGAGKVVGLDLSPAGFDTLRRRFPGIELVEADIGDPELSLEERFDVVSAMNMLLHVTDDVRWAQALGNLARLLAPGGVLLVMDPIVFAKRRGPDFDEASLERWRTIEHWRAVLAEHGLRIDRVEPATVLLATPMDARTDKGFELLWFYWRALMKVASGRERVGHLVGRPLHLLDRALTRIVPSGPTSKCLVIRRSS